MTNTRRGVLAAALTVAAVAVSAQTSYDVTFVPLKKLPHGYYSTGLSSINNLGQMTASVSQRTHIVAELCTATKCEVLPFFPKHGKKWLRNLAEDVNDQGNMAGTSRDGQVMRAFYLANGVMTNIGSLNEQGLDSWAFGINENNEVTGGGYVDGNQGRRAFHWAGGTLTVLPTLGGIYGEGRRINNAGQIVGQSQLATGEYRPTMWQNGLAINMGNLGGKGPGHATGINQAGQAVGCVEDMRGRRRAFIYQDGVMTDLGAPDGAVEVCAWGINDNGWAVGNYYPPGGDNYSSRAILWTPTQMIDLNDTIPAEVRAEYQVWGVLDINNRGEIPVSLLRLADKQIVSAILTPR